MEQKQNEQQKQEQKTEARLWTPETKAELRAKLPHKKLNAFGEWFFSEEGGKEYVVVVDEDALLRRRKRTNP